MTAGMFMPSYLPAIKYDPPGSVTFAATGPWSFIVPDYRDFLEIELIGPGGGGGGAGGGSDGSAGSTATNCSQLSMSAGPGSGGAFAQNTAPGGAGGTASGGDINTSGGAGTSSGSGGNGEAGGDAPNGGTGGAARTTTGNGNAGNPPGGGGGGGRGGSNGSAGGGAGARSFKTLARGALIPGSTLSGTNGAGGNGGFGSNGKGGNGADGYVKITWGGGTAPPVTLTDISLVDSASNSLSNNVTCPTTQAGDVLIFAYTRYIAGSGSLVPPSGFTLSGVATEAAGGRAALFHKVADGTEGGTTLSASGTNANGVMIFVFRGNVPITAIAANDVNTQTAGVNQSTSMTIPSGSGAAPQLVCGATYVFGSRTISFSPQTGRINVNSGQGAACYNIQNSTPADVSLSTNSSNPGSSAVVGCYYTFTA